MSMNAQTLSQAREAMVSLGNERLIMVSHIQEQKRKISELEREVQRQATAREQAERIAEDLRNENAALRAQIPDEATLQAYGDLVQYMTAPAATHPQLRIAA